MKAVDILKKIEENGFEAYIVGGYVRDKILGITSTDIDICTNAKVKDILDIFKDVNAYSDFYGNVKILLSDMQVDITTYRRELEYKNNKPCKIEYVDNLLEDLKRRDFVINTLCMNKDEEIIDLFNGCQDIDNRIVRCVGDPVVKINEDSTRMLRAVRFACILNFKIEEDFYQVLKKNKNLLMNIPKEGVKEELTKILINKNALMGLNLLKRLGFSNVLGIDFDNVVNVDDICGMYSQLDINDEYPFSKSEKDNIKSIQNIVKYGKIDNEILFKYGLYISMVAGTILGIDGSVITKLNNNLPISHVSDIVISSDEICDILEIEPCKIISNVYNDLTKLILNEELVNDKSSLRDYITQNRKKWVSDGFEKIVNV